MFFRASFATCMFYGVLILASIASDFQTLARLRCLCCFHVPSISAFLFDLSALFLVPFLGLFFPFLVFSTYFHVSHSASLFQVFPPCLFLWLPSHYSSPAPLLPYSGRVLQRLPTCSLSRLPSLFFFLPNAFPSFPFPCFRSVPFRSILSPPLQARRTNSR